MPPARAFSEVRLVNGSTGDPALFLDYPGTGDALLFDAGENAALPLSRLADLEAVFITHHHVDHFIGFDRIVRANLDSDKTLHVFGPAGTIRKVYERIKSYEYQYFPFQKVALRVTELAPGRRASALLECTRRFPEPEVSDEPWNGPTVYENEHLSVEAAFADHTVPCLAFALAEKPGVHPDAAKLAAGALRPGAWVGEALRRLRAGEPPGNELDFQGGRYTLGALAERYFIVSPGARVAYVTDTAWSEAVRPGLVRLARGAWRLYCDSYYATAQAKQAAKHRHMTAASAAELARAARVEELVLMHLAPRYAGQFHLLLDEARAIFARTTMDLSAGP